MRCVKLNIEGVDQQKQKVSIRGYKYYNHNNIHFFRDIFCYSIYKDKQFDS